LTELKDRKFETINHSLQLHAAEEAAIHQIDNAIRHKQQQKTNPKKSK